MAVRQHLGAFLELWIARHWQCEIRAEVSSEGVGGCGWAVTVRASSGVRQRRQVARTPDAGAKQRRPFSYVHRRGKSISYFVAAFGVRHGIHGILGS